MYTKKSHYVVLLLLGIWIGSTGIVTAQGLTQAQLQTLKTDVTVTRGAQFATELANNNWSAIAAWYNQLASPTANLWRPDVLVKEMNPAIVWVDADALAEGKKSTYMMMTQAQIIDTTSQNVRDGFSVIFGNSSATAANLMGIVKKPGTNFEVLFSSAPVQGARVSTLYSRACTYIDIQQAVTLP